MKAPKDPTSVRITLHVVNKMRSAEQTTAYAKTVTFLLAQDKTGTIVDCERLPVSGGCSWQPSTSTRGLTRAYVKLAKKKLTPGYFAQYYPDRLHDRLDEVIRLDQWFGSFGHDPNSHPNRVWVRLTQRNIGAIITRLYRNPEVIPVTVV